VTSGREDERVLSTAQAARILDVTPGRVLQLARAGRLQFTWTPLGRLFVQADVERLARERTGGRPGMARG
jgi:hypothetical protein